MIHLGDVLAVLGFEIEAQPTFIPCLEPFSLDVVMIDEVIWDVEELFWKITACLLVLDNFISLVLSYLPTPSLGQDMTQGQFLSGV